MRRASSNTIELVTVIFRSLFRMESTHSLRSEESRIEGIITTPLSRKAPETIFVELPHFGYFLFKSKSSVISES